MFEIPSLAFRLGQNLLKCAELKRGLGTRQQNSTTKIEVETFAQLHYSEWTDKEWKFINVLELKAIQQAMLHWLRQLRSLTVLVAMDNSTIVSYINKQGGTRSMSLCRTPFRFRLSSVASRNNPE